MSSSINFEIVARSIGLPEEEIKKKVSEIEKREITIRDKFAMAVMPALMSCGGRASFGVDQKNTNLSYAKCAYAVADAMLEARNG